MNDLVGQRSRSRIAPFRLHRPSTIEEAVDAMASAQPGAAYMAGGIDLVSRMKGGSAPADVVHLGRVGALARIRESEGSLHIGACATHEALAHDEAARACAPAIARCWRSLGNPRVRHKGTVGGNVMARDPAYDAALMLMAADASLTLASRSGLRAGVPIAEGAPAGSLLTSIQVPEARTLVLRADRSLHPVLSIVLGYRDDGASIGRVRVAIGCAYAEPRVFTFEGGPHSFAGLRERADALVRALPRPLHDWRASAGYRARMIGVVLRRLLALEDTLQC